MRKTSEGLAEAVLGLQRALVETQEGMARKRGCTLGAYSKWVRGDRTPSGDWLIKMLQLCPDEDTRAAFGVAPSTISVADVAVGDDEVQAYYHHAETGLKLLAESASQGHLGAKEELRHLAELIARRAAKWQHGKK